jgi:hypothetical protein
MIVLLSLDNLFGSSYGAMGHTNGRYSPFISLPTVYKTQGMTPPKLIFDFGPEHFLNVFQSGMVCWQKGLKIRKV